MAGERPWPGTRGASQRKQVSKGGGQDPDGRIRLGETKIYTLREFSHNVAGVFDQIDASGQPAAITKHGRFVALITGLADAQIDLMLTRSALADQLQARAESEGPRTYSPDEVQQRIDEHYRDHAGSMEGSDSDSGSEVAADVAPKSDSPAPFDEYPIYTMREVNQNPGRVFDKINASGQPAVLTKHGRVLAVITGLADAQIESLVLTRGGLGEQLQARAESEWSGTYSSDEVQRRIEAHYDA